ncbi:MAG: hypothetical protein ABW360_01655 [Phenylobacterium sp.]
MRVRLHGREAARQHGVAWSGLGPDPHRPRDAQALAADAARRLAARRAWSESPCGRLTAALAEIQRAAQAAHAAAEAARAALSRDPERHPGLAELQAEARALHIAVRAAMDAEAPAALSGEACATNSASPRPSRP